LRGFISNYITALLFAFTWNKIIKPLFSPLMKRIISFTLLLSLVTHLSGAQQSFDRETIDVGNIGLSVTNAGTIGRPDVVNDPGG
jgi:hypothetical protein